MKKRHSVIVAILAMATTIPGGSSTQARVVSDVTPFVTTSQGVKLTSVPCLPARRWRIPDGLTGTAAANYTPPASAVAVISCAHPTSLEVLLPVGVQVPDEEKRITAAESAYAAALDNGSTPDDAVAHAGSAFESPATVSVSPTTGNASPTMGVIPNTLCGGTYNQTGQSVITWSDPGATKAYINYQLEFSADSGCNVTTIQYQDQWAGGYVYNSPYDTTWPVTSGSSTSGAVYD